MAGARPLPSGSETCDFCLMLASRGFACRPGATASMGHVHARCDCLIVPGWPGMAAAGYDPGELCRHWNESIDLRASERAGRNGTSEAEERARIMAAYERSASRARPGSGGGSKTNALGKANAYARRIKAASTMDELKEVCDEASAWFASAGVGGATRDKVWETLRSATACRKRELRVSEDEASWAERARGYAVNVAAVESRAYGRAVEGIVGPGLADDVWKDMRHTLRVRGGTARESAYAYDLTAARRLGSTDGTQDLQVTIDGELRRAVERAAAQGHGVALIHNHPGSSLPSAADVLSLADARASVGIIACHDGSIIRFSAPEAMAGYNEDQRRAFLRNYEAGVSRRLADGKAEESVIEDNATKWGVRIERIHVSAR